MSTKQLKTAEYKGVQQFKVKHQWMDDVECVIEIDFDYPNIFENMKEHYLFYHKLKDENDKVEILNRFLQHIGAAVWFVSASGRYNTYGVRDEVSEMEGYPKLDGTTGIKLMAHEHPEVSNSDFDIEITQDYEYYEPEF